MIERIETENLVLRKAADRDLECIWNNVWKDEQIAKTMLWQPTLAYEDAVERLKRTMCFQGIFDAFFVCLKETDEAIGFAGIKEEEPGVYEDCGICVARKFQNRGFEKEM